MPATGSLSPFIGLDEAGGVVPAKGEQDGLSVETLIRYFVTGARTGNDTLKEPDHLKGLDRTPHLCLGQCELRVVCKGAAVDRVRAPHPARNGPEAREEGRQGEGSIP